MSKLITIITFDFPHEAHMAKTRLESEGFEIFLKDELTVQVDNFISNAVGGVKLQVFEEDAEAAIKILEAAGYIKEDKELPLPKNSFLSEWSSNIPFIGKLAFEVRMLVLVALIAIISLVAIVLLSLPDKMERLTKDSWYLNKIEYKGKYYQPNTNELKLTFNNGDSEYIRFSTDGIVKLPGFNSKAVYGRWKLDGEQLIISMADTLGHVYNGKYDLEIGANSISLTSETTKMKGHGNRIVLF
jgi:hypothetical protein